MPKIEVQYADYLQETLAALTNGGLLLVSANREGKPNVMAIGWGLVGTIWNKPIFVVLVRPSRFTHGLIEETGEFTVNVPPKELSEITLWCGSVSGRDYDKFAEKGLTALPAKTVKAPIIEQCLIHYECRVVHKNEVLKEELASEIIPLCYSAGDFHTLYFAEILSVQAEADTRERLATL